MNIRGISDVYGLGELEATGSALIEAQEGGRRSYKKKKPREISV